MNKIERDKKLKILLPVLVVISLLVWMPNLKDSRPGRKRLLKAGADTEEMDGLISSIPIRNKNVQEKKSSYQEWGRNPFVTEDWEPKKEPEPIIKEELSAENYVKEEVSSEPVMVLNGIFWNEKKPGALINDEVVGLGSKIGSYTVSDIKKDVVLLNDGINYVELRVEE